MKPVNFKEANIVYTKPEGWSDDECGDLPVHKGTDGKHTVLVSAWMPTFADLQRLSEGKPIYLTIVGTGMPPVALSTESPFPEQPEREPIELKTEKEVAENPEYKTKFIEFDTEGRAVFEVEGVGVPDPENDGKIINIQFVDVEGVLHGKDDEGNPTIKTKVMTPVHLIPEK